MTDLTVTFKGKIQTVYNFDETIAYRYIAVPAVDRKHVDMHAFRTSKFFGGFANSDMFPAMLKGAMRRAGVSDKLYLDRIPAAVSIDETGFLAKVVVTLPDSRD